LLHIAFLALAIVAALHKRVMPQATPPASVAMVFESGGKTPPSIANPAPLSPNQQASPAPQPSEPLLPPPVPPAARAQPIPPVEQTQPTPPVVQPPPTAPPVPVPPAPEIVPPAPVVAPTAPAPVPPAPVSPAPVPPAPTPQATPQPVPEISAPPTPAPAAQAPSPEAVPLPPPAPEAPPRAPRPREAARPAAPPRPGPAFPAPMDFSLGPRVTEPQAAPPRPHASHGSLDLSFAPMMGGGDITQLHPNGKGDDVGEDWFDEVAAWWLRHRFYPSEAGRLNQEGDVILRLVVGRDGRVEAVDVEQRSGSPWLDLGALAVFRDARLPPLPPDVRDPNVTVDFTIHYVIIR
jgi:TonB family protein